MIVLFTDFGLHGPYMGQVKAVLHQMARRGFPLSTSSPMRLWAIQGVGLPLGGLCRVVSNGNSLSLCIVDPGVGATRPAIVLEADSRRRPR